MILHKFRIFCLFIPLYCALALFCYNFYFCPTKVQHSLYLVCVCLRPLHVRIDVSSTKCETLVTGNIYIYTSIQTYVHMYASTKLLAFTWVCTITKVISFPLKSVAGLWYFCCFRYCCTLFFAAGQLLRASKNALYVYLCCCCCCFDYYCTQTAHVLLTACRALKCMHATQLWHLLLGKKMFFLFQFFFFTVYLFFFFVRCIQLQLSRLCCMHFWRFFFNTNELHKKWVFKRFLGWRLMLHGLFGF